MARSLGKGLSALIADRDEGHAVPNLPTTIAAERGSLPLSALKPGHYQPRTVFDDQALRELADSIRKNGVVQPILVRKDPSNEKTYEIIAGERRWRASHIAGLETIPAIIMELSNQQAMEVALVENIQRQDLNLLEEAEGYQRLIEEFHYTQEALAEVIGKSRSQISNTLRLLALPAKVKQMLAEDKISAGHARAILTAADPIAVAEMVTKRDLNVRQTEKLVKKLATEPRIAARKTPLKDGEITQLEKDLAATLGLAISVTNQGDKGKIVITYHNLTELDEVLRRLSNAA